MNILFSFLAAILLLAEPASALSAPKVEFDNNNVYVRAAAPKQWTASKMQELSGITVDLMQEKIVDQLASGDMPFELDIDTINQIKDTSEDMKDFITVADAYNETNQGRDQDIQELIPTAFIAMVGLKASLSVGASGAGSFTVGAVVMPIVEYIIPRRPEQTNKDLESLSREELKELVSQATTKRFTFSWAFIGWPNLDVGVGAGVSVGAVRLSGGLIWGPLQSAKDFKGLVGGVSVNAALAVGLNVKVGVVHNSDMKGFAQMKYVIAGAELGVTAEAAARVNASVIFTDDQILRMFFSGETELSGEQIIEEYRQEQLEKARAEGEDPAKFLFEQ